MTGTYGANRSFRLLWIGQSVSALGDWVATFGLMLFVRELERGSRFEGLAISGILGFRILPALVAAPVAAEIADRFDRRRTMIATDVARAGLIVLVPFAPHLAPVYAIAFVLEGLGLIFLPARDALVPGIVSRDELAGANARIMLSQWGTIPLAGALVVAADAGADAIADLPWIGWLAATRFALPFFFDAATFLVSAWALAALPSSTGRVPRADAGDTHGIRDGVRILVRDRTLRGLTLGMALATGGGGALFSLGIPYVKTTLGASDAVFGALIVIWGAGMAVGAGAAQRAKGREALLFKAALGTCGGVLAAMAVHPRVWLALLLAAAFGAGMAAALVLGITLAQSTASPDVRGRVMAAVHVLSRIFLIAGAVLVGSLAAGLGRTEFIAGWDGNRYALLIAGASMAAGGLAAARPKS